MSLPRPEHHLYWLQSAGGIRYWSSARHPFTAKALDTNIWRLRASHSDLKQYLRLWALRQPLGFDQLIQKIAANEGSREPSNIERIIHRLFLLGASESLKVLQRHWEATRPTLTPQYQQLLKQMNFELDRHRELVFHTTNPDLYLYRANPEKKNSLLICFCTKSNTLNAPLPIAHIALQRMVGDILYVRNRTGVNPADGLAGRGLEQSARLIRAISDDFGYEELYGLGTSMGGYAACVYAEALGFNRVLNFSGAPGLEATLPVNQLPLGKRILHYPLDNILTVLSANDAIDKKILQHYREHQFNTKLTLVDSATHGSFTAALLEGKLPHLVAWLGMRS